MAPRPLGQRVMYVLHLFSGRRREKDLQFYFEQAFQRQYDSVVSSAELVHGDSGGRSTRTGPTSSLSSRARGTRRRGDVGTGDGVVRAGADRRAV